LRARVKRLLKGKSVSPAERSDDGAFEWSDVSENSVHHHTSESGVALCSPPQSKMARLKSAGLLAGSKDKFISNFLLEKLVDFLDEVFFAFQRILEQ
jgi:hypothetical protein